jgi:hypothetical protein
MNASPEDTESRPSGRTDGPVFVDDSGRRHARVRILIRAGTGLVAVYVVLVVVGLAGSATLPVLHLTDLGRLHVPSAATPRLGRGSKAVALPAALQPGGKANNRARVASANRSARARGGNASNSGGTPTPGPGDGPTSVTPGSTAQPTTTATTRPAPATTAPPQTSTTAPTATTTTTLVHGPPTSTQHGPPSTRGRSGH